ncbi:MAG: PEP-CTERM sorting domain-containing protein [Burkholderiales bacterium]|nr:PEP-CTERM sorting domain-containing protein [Burkholderiales bacterium]
MTSSASRSILVASALAALSSGASGSTVTISGRLTSFQSALSASSFYPGGNGSLDGTPLAIDPSAPQVTYSGDVTLYNQSTTVLLAPGTTRVQFEYTDIIGQGRENAVAFAAGAPVDVAFGDVFKVGTVTYTNGFWYPFARVGLRIDVASADTALDGHSFAGSIVVAVSSTEPFVPDPIANADYFYLEGPSGPLSSLGSVRVYEPHVQPPGNPGNTGTVDLYARIGSLVPVRFDSPSDAAFLSASLDPLPAVPEPSVYLSMLGGLAALAWARRRKRP